MANFYGSYIGYGGGGAAVTPPGVAGDWQGDRGMNHGGGNGAGGGLNTIQYVAISVLGNTTDFGNLTRATHSPGTCSSGTRSVCGGGNAGAAIDYVTIASTGNATAFGNLVTGRYLLNACSSTTRGLWIAGIIPWGTNQIDYVELASVSGGASDFGDYGNPGYGVGSAGNGTRFIGGGGGGAGSEPTKMYYGAFDTTGATAQEFGDISVSWGSSEMWSNTTRCIINSETKLHYITMDTLGDSVEFGTQYYACNEAGGVSNGPRGLVFGGLASISTDNILYHDMSTLGNTAVFGTLTENTRDYTSGASGRPT